jgi:hypothetical protein
MEEDREGNVEGEGREGIGGEEKRRPQTSFNASPVSKVLYKGLLLPFATS